MIGHAQRHRRRHADRLMHSAEIVVRDEQRHSRPVVPQLLGKAVGQSREPALLHPQRQIAALDIACGDVTGPSAYYIPIYAHCLRWGVRHHLGERAGPTILIYVKAPTHIAANNGPRVASGRDGSGKHER